MATLWHLLLRVGIWGFGVATVLAVVAAATTRRTLAGDSCASALDNGWGAASLILVHAALGAAALSLVLAIAQRLRKLIGHSLLTLAAGVAVYVSVILLAAGGYGWHCPDL